MPLDPLSEIRFNKGYGLLETALERMGDLIPTDPAMRKELAAIHQSLLEARDELDEVEV